LKDSRSVPKIDDVGGWARSWISWWISLQPSCREGEKLVQAVEPGETWAGLKKGGTKGFYIIVVSLGWWCKALEGKAGEVEFEKMLKDVLWVCECMNGRGEGGSKEGREKRKVEGRGKGKVKRRGDDDVVKGRRGLAKR
jgi:hypothetical protein